MPDYGQMARDAVVANLNTYPFTSKINSAAALGQPITLGNNTYNFTGLGDADLAGKMSDQMAQALLDIQKNYGADYIKQRLAELQTADPEGYAARKQLFDQILSQANEQPNRPLAQNLQDSVMQLLNRNGQLDERQRQEVEQGVRGQQVGKGNYLGNAATEQESSAVVGAGSQARDQNQQAALEFLSSGASPEDVAYRRMQQSLSNLSNFYQGQTPTAEFKSLSSAGNGAVPFMPGQPNSAALDPNAAAYGAQNALALYGGQINWAENQINPWIAGTAIGAGGLRTANSLGWSPWGTTQQQPITWGTGAPGGASPGNTPYGPG